MSFMSHSRTACQAATPKRSKLLGIIRLHCRLKLPSPILTRRSYLDTAGVFSLTPVEPVCRQTRDEVSQLQEVLGPEAAPPCCSRAERIRHFDARPTNGHVVQPALPISEVNAVLAPGLPVLQELELATGQWMKRVRHPETLARILPIGCS